MKDYTDIVDKEKRKREYGSSKNNATSSSVYDATPIVEKMKLEKSIGMDTFSNEFTKINQTIQTVYGGWQTQETMQNTLATVDEMRNRLALVRKYKNKYAQDWDFDVDGAIDYYEKAIEGWGNQTELYKGYQNADAFGKAKTKAQFDEKYKGKTFDDIQTALSQLEEGSEEHNYLKGYTNYSNLEDFDKALAWAKGEYTNVEGKKANTEDRFKIYPSGDTSDIATRQLNKRGIVDGLDLFPATPTGKITIPDEKNAKAKRDESASKFNASIIDQSYIDALDRARNLYKLDNGTNDYYAKYREEEDFEELSQYAPSELEGWWDKLTDGSYGLGYGDITYEYINDVDGARSKIRDAKSKFGMDTKNQTTSQEKKGYDKLTPDEVAMYNYLYKKKGKESAQQYLDEMEVTLTKRVNKEDTENWNAFSDDHPILSSALSIPANIMGGVSGAIEGVTDAMKGKEYNPYGYYKTLSNYATTTRQNVGENIAEATEGMEILGTNVPSFLYQTGMSIGDTVVGGGTLGTLYSVVAGSSAFQQKAKELTEAGENLDVVVGNAMASGLAEMVFEYLSLDKLLKIDNVDGLRKGIKATLKQAGIEGSEELATELANIGAEALFRGDNSELEQLRKRLLEQGYSEEEANHQVWEQGIRQVAEAFAGGMVSGGVMGGGASIGNYAQNKSTGSSIRANAQTDSMWDTSAMTPEESESYEALGSKKSKEVDKLNATTTLNALDKVSKPNTEELRKQRVESLSKGEVTEVTATGNSTNIEAIKKVDGDLVITTSEGEFKADEMTFSDNDAELISYAENMEGEKANMFVSMYDGTASVDAYHDSFNLAVAYAENNISQDTMLENRGVLTPSQVGTIYTSIVTNKAKAQSSVIAKLMEKHGNTMSYNGTIDDSVIDYNNKTTDGSKVNWNSLTDSQRKGVTFLTGLAKATGLDAQLITDGLERGMNGAYMVENGKIIIDVYAGINKNNMSEDAKDTIIPALAHELTHWSKAKSPEKYQALSESIFKVLTKGGKGEAQLIDEEIVRLRKNGIKADVEYARDEIIARACEDLLSMSETGKEMFNNLSETEQKSLVAKIKDIINDLVNWVNELLTHYQSKSKEAEFLRQYKEYLQDISKQWDAMLKEAVAVNQAMKNEGITDKELQTNESTTQLSDREFENAIEQWSKEELPSGEVFILGTTGDVLQGLGAIESDIYMNGDKIKNILNDHKEITIDEIKKIPRILDNPVLVLKSKTGNSRLVMFGSVKAKNGKPMLVVLDLRPHENGFLLDDMQKVNSAYTKTETLDKTAEENGMDFVQSSEVLYLDKKRTTHLLSAIGFYMPITCNQSGYIGNISYAGEHVKLQGEAFSNVITLNTSTTQLSDRDSEYQSLYDNVQEYRKEYRTAQEELKKYKVPDINFDAEDMDAEIEKFNKWQEESGYLKASKKSENVYDKLRDAERKLQNLADELRNEMYTDFTEEDVKKYVSKAVRKYHTTSLLSRASYLTTTGSMLDFSDGQGYRVKDHREISEILDLPDYAEYSDGMITFMNMGNIRLQSYGVDISTMPNTKQMSALRSIIYKLMNDNGEFYLDVSDYRGNNVFSMTYGEKTSVSKIVADIKNYFDKGTIPEQQSSIAGFYYSDRDSDGNVLSREQQEYFKSSQVRDDNGNLLVVYHGTRKADFTVFNRTHTYFTDSKDMADSYSPNGEGYKGYLNITNPFIIDAIGERWSQIPVDAKMKAFLKEHGAGVFKEKGEWRTSPADIVYAIEDAIEEGDVDYDGVIIKNVDDTGSYGNKQGIVSNDYIVFNSNQFKNADNLKPTKDKDIRYADRDYGYHAGDLGKAESYASQGYGRGTGHFGTGTYFVGNKEKIKNYNMRNGQEAPIETVDFSKYNLFTVRNVKDGRRLHEALKVIDGGVNESWIDKVAKRDFRAVDTTERYRIAEEMFPNGDDRWQTGNQIKALQTFADQNGIEYTSYEEFKKDYEPWVYDAENLSQEEYNARAEEDTQDAYYETIKDDIEEKVETINKKYERLRDAYSDLEFVLGYRKDIAGALRKVVEHENSITNKSLAYTTDSNATVFMKTLGYEGIDVRGVKELDNTEYGSVIYDLKGEDLARKQEIGTAKFSDRIESSVYEILGENDALKKRNEILSADIQRLRERVKLEGTVTKGKVFDANQLHGVAVYLNKTVNSAYNSKQLAKDLERLYSYIAQSENLDEHSLFAKCQEIARDILAEQRGEKVVDDYYKGIIDDLRSRRITLSEEQINEVKSQYGDRYRNAFMGKITIAKDGISLDSVWQELSQMYPEVFDAETTEADQPLVLLEIYDSARESSVIYQKYNDSETTMGLATEIYNKYWTAPRVTTIADKYDAQIKKLNFEHRKAMSDLRTDFNDRLQKQKTADAIHYGKIINDLRNREKTRVQEAREFGRRRVNEVKERAEKNAKIRSITDKALTLNKWLTKNSKDEHIAEPLKKPVAYLLDAIDFSSKQLLGMNGDARAYSPTQKDISLSQALEQVHDMAQGINSAQIGEDDISAIYGTFVDFPVGFADDVRELSRSVNDTMRTVGDNEFVLNQMSLEELETLDKIVATIKSTVTKMNKFLAVRHAQGVANLSQTDINYLDSLGKGKNEGSIRKLLNWGNALPYYAFKRFGEGGQKVYEALMDGWDKFSFHTKSIIDYAENTYTEKEIKEWEKDIKTIKVLEPVTDAEMDSDDYEPTYQTIQMTVPQIMSLYCLQKREQAKDHLIGGGIRISDIEVKNGAKKNVISQSEGVTLAESEIANIISNLTDRQIAVADKLQEFMNTTCTEWGNEVSMRRFGYKAFGEENYFPIQSDKNNLAVNDETENNNSLFRLLNMSFTKSTIKKANNRVVISNIFDVFAQHTSDMAKYNALALPILDAFKWYNYKEKVKQGETQHKTKSLKQSLENAFGKNAQSYITTFLRDINGADNTSRDTVGKHFFTSAKIASVGANLRVALLQPTSYLRASAVIDTKYLVRAMAHKPKIAKAEKYCGIALWKALGFYDTNIQRGVTELIKHSETIRDKAVEISMKGAEWGDKVTWGYLWNACELEVRETQKDLKVGSDEFYRAIGKRLSEVIYATQVVDSTMTRSQMMRSSDMYDKMLTSFASEPTLSYNMMQDAIFEIKLAKRRGEGQSEMKRHRKHFVRVAMAYTVTNMMCALVEAGFDAFRDDEEEEMDLMEFMKMYLKNFATDMSITAKVPYIKEAVSIMQGYTSSRTDTQWMQSFYYAGKGFVKIMQGEGNAYTTFKNITKALSYVSGLPFFNAWRDSVSFLNKTDILSVDELEDAFNDTFGIE